MNSKLFHLILIILSFFIACEDSDVKVKTDISLNDLETAENTKPLAKKTKKSSNLKLTGITDKEILIGTTSALTGAASFLGRQTTNGALAYIREVNDNGGIHGRKVKVIGFDDAYDPPRCISNTTKLVQDEKVFSLFNYVGTPTSVKIISYVEKNAMPVVGLFTGAEALRTPLKKYIFNIRASYFQETDAIVSYFVNEKKLNKIAVFYQNDAYGMAGLKGAEIALKKFNLKPVALGTYKRGSLNVTEGLNSILKGNPEAVIMIGYYGPCAKFILEAKAKNKNLFFHNVSFVGPDVLIKLLKNNTDNVYVTQVVPPPTASDIPVVQKYQQLLTKSFPMDTPNFVSIEGFINAMILVKALEKAGKDIDRDKFVNALESMNNLDIGGVTINFSNQDHQGMKNVYITLANNNVYELVKQ